MKTVQKFQKVLVANRGEIAIRVFRACAELGIRSVAIYTAEDKNALFRLKADESYLIGKNKGPVAAYLDIDEIIKLAVKKGVDAIHPGYGFLSENPEFVKKCEEAGIVFIGPDVNMMNQLGDKIKSKQVAISANVPVIPGVEKPIETDEEAIEFAKMAGYPIILKASAGGGGRGMRIVNSEEELLTSYHSAKSEAKKAFGVEDVFVEKYLDKPKHIEVQVLGDSHGNLVHLYERDCSIQRRHQKLIEFSPSLCLTEAQRSAICEDALKIAQAVNYQNAGTCEFLVDQNGKHYFIEMNPRIQVEHTVTEMVTGVDLVQAQILVAEGYSLDSPEIGIPSQASIHLNGYAIQCRVTTEDPINHFAPDTGKMDVYRTGGGFGIRLDGGNGFTGAEISPYYDSLLVKSTAWSRTFEDAIRKQIRSIKEIRVEGVKTNTGFLINVLNHEVFQRGACDTGFIAENKDLFDIRPKADVELRVLNYLGNKVVNEREGEHFDFDVAKSPKYDTTKVLYGTKNILDDQGAEGLVKWVKSQNKLLLTDTTMRDAHQSLMATRLRTNDMTRVGRATANLASDLFSLEMWGGATFDVAYRFLHEDPWERLRLLRERIPNILFQMLIRGANGVGYKNYPDNVVRALIQKSASNGIDVFRIFDSLNWLKGMEVAIDEVLKTGKVAEACICYTGDILDDRRDKYSLQYYVDMAKEIEKTGAHILAIKDMSALLKPYAAYKLVSTLKEAVDMPIHIHTHDTTGNGVATILMAAEAGADIVDTAFNAMSGLTSQPALNSVVAALKNTARDTQVDLGSIEKINEYWSNVRPIYGQFETDLKASTAEIYKYEIPGGQYSNLKPQVESFGLGHRFNEVKEMYKTVNNMFGDIVKVTPSSKAVGDMAIFMIQNNLDENNILQKGADLAYPDSVVSYFGGMMGQPQGGFPKDLQKLVLKGEKAIECRPGELLEPEDFEGHKEMLEAKYGRPFTEEELISYALYPKVFEEYLNYVSQNGDFSKMRSAIFFHGISEGETGDVHLEEGKILAIKLLEISKMTDYGTRRVIFEVNGNRREVEIKDKASRVVEERATVVLADPTNPLEIGSSIPGTLTKVLVAVGDKVEENQSIAIIEAMKMETVITAPATGTVLTVHVNELTPLKAGELIITLK